ncbi:MAG: DNA polymerase III subunit delta, partial [Alistipes sp.]|nr:DNA polymerase III subunit delta [Alistipes sp.]
IVNLCRQMPMMGTYEVIILKEAQHLRQIDKLSHYTSKPQPTTILIICHKEKSLDKRSALYKQCQKEGVVFESVRPRDYEIGAWLSQFIAQRGLRIAPKALQMLTDHLGCDISKISNELDKLMVSLPAGTIEITDAHIEQNVGISKDYNNFELCNAVAVQDIKRAMNIADHFAHNPKDNPLLVTIMSLYGLFRDLFIINYLRWQERQRKATFPNDMELMRILKKSNIYAIGELKQQAMRWDNRRVFNILGLLRQYDGKSKGIDTGGMNDGELLRELLLKIFMQ